MKLRIRGHSIRLRLTQTEVDTLRDAGIVAEHTAFGSGRALTYAVVCADDADTIRAGFEEDRITVSIPRSQVVGWVDSDQVSLEGSQAAAGGEVLALLVEKDFKCLHRPPAVDDADTFPHPLAADSAA
jgi:hypothetical protein